MQITVNKLKERLSGVVGTFKYNVAFGEELYKALTAAEVAANEAETMEDLKKIIADTLPLVQVTSEEIIGTTCNYLVFNANTNKFYLKNNGVVSKYPMPKPLADWIIESSEKGLDFMPVVKAWTRFLRNPKFTVEKAERFAKYLTTTVVDKKVYEELVKQGLSHEVATERATFRDVSLTRSGMISTYKYAQIIFTKFDKETGDRIDRYEKTYDEETGTVTVKLPEWAEDYALIPPIMGTGGTPAQIRAIKAEAPTVEHRIKVGCIHSLDWNDCNCQNDNMAASFWIGGLSYIEEYAADSRLLLNCLVDPANITSFYHGSNFDAIKTREYFVHSAVFAPNKNLYREIDYEQFTEKEWNAVRAEAIKLSEQKIEELKKAQEQMNAL